MAIKTNRDSTLLGSHRPYNSSTTHSSARKFLAAGSVANPDDHLTGSLSNSEYIVEQAAGLSSMAMIVESIAAQGRAALKSVRNELSGVPTDPDMIDRRNTPSFNDFDVDTMKRLQVDTALDAFAPDEDDRARAFEVIRTVVDQGVSSFLSKRQLGESKSVVNTIIPDIESISVEMNKNKGSIDAFFVNMKFNLPRVRIESGEVKAIRVFRSEVIDPNFVSTLGRLSIHGVDRLMATRQRTRVKNQDHTSVIEHRFAESNIDNSISLLIPFDGITQQRNAAARDDRAINIPRPMSVTGDEDYKAPFLKSFLLSPSLSVLDRSVIQNNKVLENIKKQSPHLSPGFKLNNVVVGRSSIMGNESRMGNEHFNQLVEDESSDAAVIDRNNAHGFKEIAFFSPDKLEGRTFGEFVEYMIEDTTVSFGRSYKYYIVTIDSNMVESVRSEIVSVDIDGLRIPPPPDRVNANVISCGISLSMLVDDQLIEKFEVYRKGDSSGPFIDSQSVRIVSGPDGFTSEESISERSDNGFILVGEVLNGTRSGGGVFCDERVGTGRRYSYRIYSVDVFGNKSAVPKEVSVYVRDPVKIVDLLRPTITAEIDGETRRARITLSCDDDRIKTLMLSRRDLSLKQKAFTIPSDVSRNVLGVTGRHEGIRMFDDDDSLVWNGKMENVAGEQNVFIDFTAKVDHTYQYRVVGVDRFGNHTDFVNSEPLMIVRGTLARPPTNLSAEVFVEGGRPISVSVAWEDGNIDISSEDRIGNREVLDNTRVRTLYQVERKRRGEGIWKRFPMTEETSLTDTVNGDTSLPGAEFKPENLRDGETYSYRVQAYQSGSVVSNLTAPIDVFVGVPVNSPQNFRIRHCNTKCRPIYAMLNWDTPANSGPVDRWEIERAAVNNFAASRMNFRNPLDFENLDYVPHREVFRESSRFQSKVLDSMSFFPVSPSSGFGRTSFRQGRPRRSNKSIVGQHHLMDNDVELGNSYFYRIRAVGVDGTYSGWVFRGIKLTEDVFSAKQSTVLSADDRTRMAKSFKPFSFGKNFLSLPSELRSSMLSSYSYGPNKKSDIVTRVPTSSVFVNEKPKSVVNEPGKTTTLPGGQFTVTPKSVSTKVATAISNNFKLFKNLF